MQDQNPNKEDAEHAIKSPLCSIQMAASLLSEKQSGPLTKTQKKLVEILIIETKRLNDNLLKHELLTPPNAEKK